MTHIPLLPRLTSKRQPQFHKCHTNEHSSVHMSTETSSTTGVTGMSTLEWPFLWSAGLPHVASRSQQLNRHWPRAPPSFTDTCCFGKWWPQQRPHDKASCGLTKPSDYREVVRWLLRHSSLCRLGYEQTWSAHWPGCPSSFPLLRYLTNGVEQRRKQRSNISGFCLFSFEPGGEAMWFPVLPTSSRQALSSRCWYLGQIDHRKRQSRGTARTLYTDVVGLYLSQNTGCGDKAFREHYSIHSRTKPALNQHCSIANVL
jgi:hypothetical protein